MTAHTLGLSDSLTIGESMKNNVELELAEIITITDVITSTNFIVRTGDTAFIRSDVF